MTVLVVVYVIGLGFASFIMVTLLNNTASAPSRNPRMAGILAVLWPLWLALSVVSLIIIPFVMILRGRTPRR